MGPINKNSDGTNFEVDSSVSSSNASDFVGVYNDSSFRYSKGLMENSIFFRILCSNCNKEVPIRGFNCNHNLCDFCLTLNCCEMIYDFLNHYKLDDQNVDDLFKYVCPVPGCLSKINVPTIKVLKNLNEYIRNSNYSQHFQKFNLLTQNLEEWIPYFDGLSFKHIFYN